MEKSDDRINAAEKGEVSVSDKFYQNLGAKLRVYRKIQQITLKQLSEALSKSLATVSKYEKGEIVVDLEVLIDWCRYLNVDIATLLPSSKETETDKQRYAGNYIDRLYLYSYMGHKNKLHIDVIEIDNTKMRATLYLDVADVSNIYESSFIYFGEVIYSDISINFVFFNASPPFDMLTFSMPTLSEEQDYRIGMMSSMTFTYQNIAIKVLASCAPVTDKTFLIEKLQLSGEEFRNMKQLNFFKI